MGSEERSRLEAIDTILRSEEVRAQIRPVVERVRAKLARDAKALMAWEPIPLTTFGNALPAAIQSSWVFILRAGANTGAERHPNSHQRMMTLDGTGDMQVGSQPPSPKLWRAKESAVSGQTSDDAIQWLSNILVSDLDVPLDERWISIPPNVWHQPVVATETDWVVVSFHTVPAEELIEERPGSGEGGTKQMRY